MATTVILSQDNNHNNSNQDYLSCLILNQSTVQKLILDRIVIVDDKGDDDSNDGVAKRLGHLIAKSPKLETICLLRPRFSSEKSLRILFQVGINKCTSLKCLCICGCYLPTSSDASSSSLLSSTLLSCLAKLLQQQGGKSSSCLEKLHLSHCHFRDRDIVQFARKGLRLNNTTSSLQRLVISRNPRLRDKGACAILKAIILSQHHYSKLELLDLSYNGISMESHHLLTTSLCPLSMSSSSSPTKTPHGNNNDSTAQLSLNLHGNERIGRGDGIVMLCKVLLSNNPTIIHDLSLSKCGIDNRGMGYISEALKYNTTLRSLDLKRNHITSLISIEKLVNETIRPHNMTLERILLDDEVLFDETTSNGEELEDELDVLLEWNRLGRQCLLQGTSSSSPSSFIDQLQRISQDATHPLTLLFMTLRQKPDLIIAAAAAAAAAEGAVPGTHTAKNKDTNQ